MSDAERQKVWKRRRLVRGEVTVNTSMQNHERMALDRLARRLGFEGRGFRQATIRELIRIATAELERETGQRAHGA